MEIILEIKSDWWIKTGLIVIPRSHRHLFPPAGNAIRLKDETEGGHEIRTHMHNLSKGRTINRIDGLRSFYKRHPSLTVGSRLRLRIDRNIVSVIQIEN